MKTLLASLTRQLKTLRGFFFLASLATAALIFLGASLTSSPLYERLVAEQTLEVSQGVARQSFNSLYQDLRSGGTRQLLNAAIAADMAAFPKAQHRIRVYRSAAVEKPSDRTRQTLMPEEVRRAFANGKEEIERSPYQIRYFYPLAAEASCLQCHRNVRQGEVLGVVAIEHTLRPISAKVRLYFIGLFLVISSLVLLAGGGVYLFAMKRFRSSRDLFRTKIESVGTMKDLNQLDVSRTNLGFEEFNEIFRYINLLVERLKNIAVDKDILPFEIKTGSRGP